MKRGNVATSNKRAETEVAEVYTIVTVRRPEKVKPRAFFLSLFLSPQKKATVKGGSLIFGTCWVISMRACLGVQIGELNFAR